MIPVGKFSLVIDKDYNKFKKIKFALNIENNPYRVRVIEVKK